MFGPHARLCAMCAVPSEARKGHSVSWNGAGRCLWPAMSVLGIEPGYSAEQPVSHLASHGFHFLLNMANISLFKQTYVVISVNSHRAHMSETSSPNAMLAAFGAGPLRSNQVDDVDHKVEVPKIVLCPCKMKKTIELAFWLGLIL